MYASKKSIKKARQEENKLRGEGLQIYKELAENMALLGTCKCEGPLFSYLKSNPENRFNVYCTTCGSVSDVRFIKDGDEYLCAEGQNPITLLCSLYETAGYEVPTDEELEKTPISPLVNKIHGDI